MKHIESVNPATSPAFARHSRLLAALLVGSAMLLPLAGYSAEDDVVKTSGTVTYVSGGVSDESLDHLKSMSSEFNLKLVFALNSGAFMSDVNVAISDSKGNSLLNTKSHGPWLLAKLPAGNYQVVATSSSGVSMTRSASVGAGTKEVDFRWGSE
jgi:hypothetical protein